MIREVIVVEGKNDTKRLQSFFEVDTIETHGAGLKKETIELIREINDKRGVILFLDPDTPGERIRKRLNEEIPGLKNAFVMKEDARTRKKVGIEHADERTLRDALNHLISYQECKDSINQSELYELGLSGDNHAAAGREKICRYYHLGKCNGKTLLKRLNMLGIKKEELKKVLEK